MQGRIAMWHALGDAVSPLNLGVVCANIFTDPQIATVGCSQADVDSGRVDARTVMLPLATNPRAKMDGFDDGFVKLFASTGVGTVVGGVIVAPRASELIHAVALAVQHHLTVDQRASTFTIYPRSPGRSPRAARRLHFRPGRRSPRHTKAGDCRRPFAAPSGHMAYAEPGCSPGDSLLPGVASKARLLWLQLHARRKKARCDIGTSS